MKVERTRYRVIKTLAPSDRGAIEYARQYAGALVCVRHRTDAKGKVRHTTVELLVQSRPIRPRSRQTVQLRLEPAERTLRAIVETAGGRWNSKQGVWELPSRVATILNLRHRVLPRQT